MTQTMLWAQPHHTFANNLLAGIRIVYETELLVLLISDSLVQNGICWCW